jgi:hypothetical protein
MWNPESHHVGEAMILLDSTNFTTRTDVSNIPLYMLNSSQLHEAMSKLIHMRMGHEQASHYRRFLTNFDTFLIPFP